MAARRRLLPTACLCLLTIVWTLPGCGSTSTSTNTVGPSSTKCAITAESSATTFPSSGGNGSLAVRTDRECPWTATSDSTWLVFTSSRSGQGSGTVSFSVTANPAPAVRAGFVSVNEQRVRIAEEAAPCRFELDRSGETVEAGGSDVTVRISTLDGCGWRTSTNADWLNVRTTTGSGSGEVRVTVAANIGAARETTLLVAGLPFGIRQQGVPVATPLPPTPAPPPGPAPPPPPPPPPTCSYQIAPTNHMVAASGEEFAVGVTTDNGCAWTAESRAGWLSASPRDGSGSGTVTVRADPNTATTSRSGSVVIAGRSIRVEQGAAPAPPRRTVRIEGEISRLSGDCPTLSFVIDGAVKQVEALAKTTVLTGSGTTFSGGSCSSLRNRDKARVTGEMGTDGRVTASIVEELDR